MRQQRIEQIAQTERRWKDEQAKRIEQSEKPERTQSEPMAEARENIRRQRE